MSITYTSTPGIRQQPRIPRDTGINVSVKNRFSLVH